MNIKDYFKKHGKQFLKSAATYSKHKSVEKFKSTEKKTESTIKQTEDSSKTPEEKAKTIKQMTKMIDYEKEFINHFKQLTCRHHPLGVWSDFVSMFACSISNSLDKQNFDKREKMYLQIIKKYDEKEQDVFPKLAADTVMALEKNQEQDFLGRIYMQLGLGNKSTSQFFTPYNICRMMAEMLISDISLEIKQKGYISINDPCCGAGATLIAGVNAVKKSLEKENMNFQNHVFIVAQDIDFTVAAMCYIQLSLLGVAGYVKVGNSLTEPITENDNLENCWFTPMYFSDIWHARRLLEKTKKLFKEM